MLSQNRAVFALLSLLLPACGGTVEAGPPQGVSTLPDAGGPDAKPDSLPPIEAGKDATQECGTTVLCVDCACQCPGGKLIPYGGCFNECQTIPPEVKNCSADCNAMCGTKSCSTAAECPTEQVCVFPPCETCGPEPVGVCLPKPCSPDGCYTDAECDQGMHCVGESIPTPQQGRCLKNQPPPGCWEQVDCPPEAQCVGPSMCPPCAMCDMPDVPGTCQSSSSTVVLWVQKVVYYTPGPVQPVWFNFTTAPIYLPGCATYDLEAFNGANWKNLGSTVDCGWEGIAVKVLPQGAHTTNTAVIDLSSAYGQYTRFRLRGYWYVGCVDNQPISTAQCTETHETLSAEFLVQWPLD